VIAHIVLYTPKPDLARADAEAFARAIQDSMRRIPDLRRALVGPAIHVVPNYSRPMSSDYAFAAILEFNDVAALKRYLEHPLHKQLGKLFWEFCETAVVVEAEMSDVLTTDVSL
jgi:hypothetical protein